MPEATISLIIDAHEYIISCLCPTDFFLDVICVRPYSLSGYSTQNYRLRATTEESGEVRDRFWWVTREKQF